MEENRNFILAIVLTLVILFGWEFFYGTPMREEAEQSATEQALEADAAGVPEMSTGAVEAGGIPGMASPVAKEIATSRNEVITGRQNIIIEGARVKGTINLKGLRFDDLTLADYREEVDPNSPQIILLNPSDSFKAYFADFGWIGDGKRPDANSVWSANKSSLSSNDTVTFTWDNGEGLMFTRDISLDQNYMFTVKQSVQNNSDTTVAMATYGLSLIHI